MEDYKSLFLDWIIVRDYHLSSMMWIRRMKDPRNFGYALFHITEKDLLALPSSCLSR